MHGNDGAVDFCQKFFIFVRNCDKLRRGNGRIADFDEKLCRLFIICRISGFDVFRVIFKIIRLVVVAQNRSINFSVCEGFVHGFDVFERTRLKKHVF